MNAKTFKWVTLYAMAALIGGGIGYKVGTLIVDKYLSEKPEEMPEEKAEPEKVRPEAKVEPEKKAKKRQKKDALKDLKDLERMLPDDGQPRDYTKFHSDNKPPISEVVRAKIGASTPISKDGPRVILFQEFNDDIDETYEVINLTYWALDDTLSNPQEEIVDDRDRVIGKDTLKSFGNDPDDPDVIYVCNDAISTVYEVTRVAQSYAEVVGGFVEEEEEKPAKKKGKPNGTK